MTLGDSGAPEDSSLGMYGALTKDPKTKAQEKIQFLRSEGSSSSQSTQGQGAYTRPTNRPIDIR